MEVFISWSGYQSHKVANALCNWLPRVLPFAEPRVAPQHLEKGIRWATGLAELLRDAEFGIVCLTPDNLASPWVHWEAGALSAADLRGKVAPLLIGVCAADVPPTLAQFQWVRADKTDLHRLVRSININAKGHSLTEGELNNAFERHWEDLAVRLRGPLRWATRVVRISDWRALPRWVVACSFGMLFLFAAAFITHLFFDPGPPSARYGPRTSHEERESRIEETQRLVGRHVERLDYTLGSVLLIGGLIGGFRLSRRAQLRFRVLIPAYCAASVFSGFLVTVLFILLDVLSDGIQLDTFQAEDAARAVILVGAPVVAGLTLGGLLARLSFRRVSG